MANGIHVSGDQPDGFDWSTREMRVAGRWVPMDGRYSRGDGVAFDAATGERFDHPIIRYCDRYGGKVEYALRGAEEPFAIATNVREDGVAVVTEFRKLRFEWKEAKAS